MPGIQVTRSGRVVVPPRRLSDCFVFFTEAPTVKTSKSKDGKDARMEQIIGGRTRMHTITAHQRKSGVGGWKVPAEKSDWC
jgi:hypothetical protein